MRFLVAVVFLLCLTAGCSSRPRCGAYHFTSSYPADLRESARTAAARWSSFSGMGVAISDEDSEETACSLSYVASDTQLYADLQAEALPGVYAAHRDQDGSIYLAADEWSKDEDSNGRRVDFATSILMHELAHEFGLGHVEDSPESVMGVLRPGVNLAYSTKDREELDRVTH